MAKKKKESYDFSTNGFAGLQARLSKANLGPIVPSCQCTTLGIDIPSLALQRLIGTNIMPFGILQIIGKEGSCKTTLAYEVISWILDSMGDSVYISTESKDNFIRNAILGWDYEKSQHVGVYEATSYEEWMGVVTNTFEYYKEQAEDVGDITPVAVCVDSITAVATDSDFDNAQDTGVSKAAFPTLAKQLNQDAKRISDWLTGFPFMFIALNHMKPGVSSDPKIKDVIPGGRAMQYYARNTLELARIGTIATTRQQGSTIKIQTRKACTAPTGLVMKVNVFYWSETDPIDPTISMPRCMWDWPAADIQMLLDIDVDKSYSADAKRRIQEISGIHAAKKGTSLAVWSDVLGITEDSPALYHDAGIILRNNSEVWKALQKELGIQLQTVFVGGNSYKDTLAEAQRAQSEHIKQLSETTITVTTEGE